MTSRLERLLTDEGHPVEHVRAVLPHATRPYTVDTVLRRLAALVETPDFQRLNEALQRAHRIVPPGTVAGYDPAALVAPAERRLHDVLATVRSDLGDPADLDRFVAVARRIVAPVDVFFDDVFVMADDAVLRTARLGLLATVWDLGAGVLDWEHLKA